MQGIATLPYEVVEEEVELPLVPDNGLHTLKDAADMLADFGRRGDIYIAHVAEGETVIPLPVLNANPKMKKMIWQQFEEMGIDPEQYIVGTELNMTNPATGVREFGFFSGVKKIFKKVKKAVKKVVTKIKPILKTILPIVASIAAPYLLPATVPAWLAGGIGSLVGTFAAGKRKAKDLLMSFGLGSLGGLGKQWLKTGNMFGSSANPNASFWDFGGTPGGGIGNLTESFSNFRNPLSPETWGFETWDPTSTQPTPNIFDNPNLASADGSINYANQGAFPTNQGAFPTTQVPDPSLQLVGGTGQPIVVQTADGASQLVTPDQAYALEASGNLVDGRLTPQGTNLVNEQVAWSSGAPSVADQAVGGTGYNPGLGVEPPTLVGDYTGSPLRPPSSPLTEPPNWWERNISGPYEEYLSPNRPGIQPDYADLSSKIATDTAASEQAWNLANPGQPYPEALSKAITQQAIQGAQPGMLEKYWRLGGIGAAGAVAADYATKGQVLGLFSEEDTDGDGEIDQWRNNRTGQLYYEDPTQYGYGSDFYGDNPYYTQEHVPTYVQQPVTVATGGEIVGPGTATSDSIPALLSDGEFVVNAATVQGIGGGDRKEGAKKLYAMQRAYDQRAA